MLYTNLNHLETATWYKDHVFSSKYVLLVCGNMGPKSVKLYRLLVDLKDRYKQVEFFDMECDNPNLNILDFLPEDNRDVQYPIVILYKDGQVWQVRKSGVSLKGMSRMLDELISEDQ